LIDIYESKIVLSEEKEKVIFNGIKKGNNLLKKKSNRIGLDVKSGGIVPHMWLVLSFFTMKLM